MSAHVLNADCLAAQAEADVDTLFPIDGAAS